MKILKLSVLVLFLLLPPFATEAAQRRRSQRPTATPKASPAPPSANPIASPVAAVPSGPVAPVTVATVNGQTLTTADLDPQTRKEIDGLEDEIAQARRNILDKTINTLLLDLEARKRKLTTAQLFNLEVTKRVPEPTPNEIAKFIEDNKDQIGAADEATTRKQVVEFLRAKAGARVQEEFVTRLRKTNPVVLGVNINTPNLAPSAVIGTVAGEPLVAGPVLEKLKPVIFKLRRDTYELEKAAVDRLINDILVIAEAQRRNVPAEMLMRTEISEKTHRPTEAEISKFYEENRKRINGELSAIHDQLAQYLEERDRQRLENEFSERLRSTANVKLFIQEPVAPTLQISVDDDPSRGAATAPVTIVEFSDFQCPACAGMYPVMENVLKSYGDKVRFVMRDFPLSIHANARKAAEAANAAHAQGKFFEYAALLFERQQSLDPASLKQYATELGLDRARFDAALDKGTYAAEVQHDLVDGENYGVEQTPTIYINGVELATLSDEALRAAIDRALASAKVKAP